MVRSHRMCVAMYVPVAQTLPTDRRFLLQNCGNPIYHPMHGHDDAARRPQA